MKYSINCLYSVMRDDRKKAIFTSDNKKDCEAWVRENEEVCENCMHIFNDPYRDYPCNKCKVNDHEVMGKRSYFKCEEEGGT